MIDYRLPENRREGYIKWLIWGIRTTDCDPAISNMNYIFKKFQCSEEQKHWFCFLYGTTYDLATSFVIFNKFPDIQSFDLLKFKEWYSKNLKNLHYQTDCKYNKGALPDMFRSYMKNVKGDPISYFNRLSSSENPSENFEKVYSSIKSDFYKFGRYMSWFYSQTLKSCLGLKLEPNDLFIGQPGSYSHTDGLCYILNREDLLTGYYDDSGKKHKNNPKFSKEDVRFFQEQADDILREAKERFPNDEIDHYLNETALCSYKKLFRRKNGRYPGYYIDRIGEDIQRMENVWSDIDFSVLWEYRKKCLPHKYLKELSSGNRIQVKNWIDKEAMNEFLDTGFVNALCDYEDLI